MLSSGSWAGQKSGQGKRHSFHWLPDLTPLTPNHFLHGQLGGRFAPNSVDTEALNRRKRWRRFQELVRHFWHRRLQEWIPSLSARKKWSRDQVDLKVGDVVVIMSPDTPRGKWPLERIVKVFPGKDSKVRVVEVQVGKTVLRRPIVKLCPLERCWTLNDATKKKMHCLRRRLFTVNIVFCLRICWYFKSRRGGCCEET